MSLRLDLAFCFFPVVFSYACAFSSVSLDRTKEPALNEKIDQLVVQLTQEPSVLEKKVAVTELTDLSGQKTALTAFLTNRLIDQLAETRKIQLIERSRLDTIVKELDLSMSGYIDERSEKLLGKMLGADAIVAGTVTDLGATVDMTVRLIRTESGEILAAGQVEVAKDRKLQSLAGRILAMPSAHYRPPLEVRMNLVAQRKAGLDRYEEVGIHEGAVLRSGDNLQLHFSTNADCYVYVLLFDSQGKASRLFPNPKIAMDNQVKANVDYRIPPGDLWFYLDERTGTETIYLSASYEPMGRLDALLSEMERVGDSRQRDLSDQIRESVGSLYRGMGPSEKPKPPRPIEITGTVGHETTRGATGRGVGGIRTGAPREFILSDGRTVQKVTEVVRGYATVVRAISFEHRD